MSLLLRRCMPLVALLCALTLPAVASHASGIACHDFVRFHERWELCTTPDGAMERHRLGVIDR